MGVIPLSPLDLTFAGGLVLLLAALSWRLHLGVAGQIVVAALRMTVQLLLVGLVLEAIFSYVHIGWIALMAVIMLVAAGREVMARQKRRFTGWWGFGAGTTAMFVSSFAVMVLALTTIVQPTPWYEPQYAIPMLGMMLGNTMNGVTLGINHLTQTAWQQRPVIEQRLLLGQTRSEAIRDIRHEAMRTGMIPIINSMAAAGLVSLPGMMTGQILAGSPPVEAVTYQILIMFLIASGTGFGVMVAVMLSARRIFDERHRLRLDRLVSKA
jgi:putative ABC transport system permease protein